MVSGLLSYVAAADACKNTFLGLLPWNYYLTMQQDASGACSVVDFHLLGGNSSILLILLVIVDDLLRIIGLLAVIFVIYAGVKYILSMGDPGETSKAQSTVINALVGLGIAMVSIAFVSFLGSALGGSTTGSQHAVAGLDLSTLPNPLGVANGNIIVTALSIAFNVIGALALLIIVIGGFRYVLSQGDAQNAAKAKNTIVYALVGLVVAIVAQSIVSFAVNKHP